MIRHRSPGITSVYNEIKASRRNRILDLGPLTQGTFQFFAQQSCKIHFENLDEFIADNQQLPIDKKLEALELFISQHDVSEKFDVILAWDLLNHLELDLVKKLFELLNPWCKSDTLLHCMRYLGHDIPDKPRKFHVLDKHFLQFKDEAVSHRRIPYHQTSALLKHLPGYYMHSSMIQVEGMFHGIAEHVLRYMPDKRKRKMYSALAEITQPTVKSCMTPSLAHHSPAIAQTLSHLQKKSGSVVLDLGPKINGNMDVWRSCCKEVFNEDLSASLRWHKASDDSQEPNLSAEALSFSEETKFDAVVLWDIPNYCNKALLQQVIGRLEKHFNTGCKVIVLAYVGSEIPAEPRAFFLEKNGMLQLSDNTKTKRKHATITSSSMMKFFPELEVQQTFVYQQGMQHGICEFIFNSKTDCNENLDRSSLQNVI